MIAKSCGIPATPNNEAALKSQSYSAKKSARSGISAYAARGMARNSLAFAIAQAIS